MSQRQDHEIIKIADDDYNENATSSSTQLHVEEKIPPKENTPHNGKPIIKMAISPQSKYVLTYREEDESFIGWFVNDGPLTFDKGVEPFSEQGICDFKISDEKIILYHHN